MSVVLPKFVEPENKKWVIEIENEDGTVTYKAKDDAPNVIKKSIRDWENMFKRAKEAGIQL